MCKASGVKKATMPLSDQKGPAAPRGLVVPWGFEAQLMASPPPGFGWFSIADMLRRLVNTVRRARVLRLSPSSPLVGSALIRGVSRCARSWGSSTTVS